MTKIFKELDWVLFLSVLAISFLGIITMKPFGSTIHVVANGDYFFERQIIWLALGILVFFLSIRINWNFFKTNSIFIFFIYLLVLSSLFTLIFTADSIRGATSWYRISSLSVEPVELMKLVLILLLAKYFSKRHVEIARVRHIFISGAYAFLPAGFVFLHSDFGSAMILGSIWLGMSLAGGIRFKHLFLIFLSGAVLFGFMWGFFLAPYQKARIVSFLSPQSDIRGSGYHAFQSVIAVGSGKIFGKGVGFGTQSRLEFLPENETDFIFASFAEEWGFVGVVILFLFFGIVLWRILRAGIYGESNFEKLYAAGLSIFLFSQIAVHIGMNIGVFPITGLGLPFMSYGGSFTISLLLSLGILQSFNIHKKGIFLGPEDRYKEGIL